MDQIPVTTPSNEPPSSPKFNPRNIVIFLGAILLLGSIVFYSLMQPTSNSNDEEKENTPEDVVQNIAPHTLVYGSWTDSESVIMAYDMSSGKQGVVAKLPSNVKKVSVLSPDTLLYINNTDVRDYGTEIVRYNTASKTTTPVVAASPGFGIDDYVLSPDMQYIATWEVQPDPAAGTLAGGKSRVYTARVSSPDQKNLIYDENAAPNPVHYPRAILNDGTVFMDRFLPNDGAGWAYGMSVSNFTGTQKQDLANMQNGTYGTQPVLSPDGKYLAFAGYDGAFGVGTTVNRGFRQAILTPNTVELLDTATRQRTKLPKISPLDIYSNVSWDEKGTAVSFSIISKTGQSNGNYIYDMGTQLVTKKTETSDVVSAALDTDKLIVGEPLDTDGSLGNLGAEYDVPMGKMEVVDAKSGKTVPLGLSSSITQVITVVPGGYFTQLQTSQMPSDENLQLRTFYLKPTIEPKRITQQSNQKCRYLATEQCNAALGTNYPLPSNISQYKNPAATTDEFAQCYNNQLAENKGKCSDSPLYLYGPKGTELTVTVHTPIFDPSATYEDGFHATLNGDGTFDITGQTHSSIDFDYTPALRRMLPPKFGSIVPVSDLEKTLRSYATKLGLNQKETFDLVQYGKTSVSGPYVFVSFYDHETSHAILPMTFSKKPDTYRNIVFYFKNLVEKTNYSPELPKFEKIERGKLTVIEVSGIVE